MDTAKCAALLKVLELGSLSAAAQALGYTPSGVSRMMAAMESETGLPLLRRGRHGVEATEECAALLPTIRALARLDEQLRQETAALRGCETGTVRIGCIYGIYYDWLAQVIAAFSARHPGIEVRILQDSSSPLCAALERHEADLCVVSRREGDFDFLPLRDRAGDGQRPRLPRARHHPEHAVHDDRHARDGLARGGGARRGAQQRRARLRARSHGRGGAPDRAAHGGAHRHRGGQAGAPLPGGKAVSGVCTRAAAGKVKADAQQSVCFFIGSFLTSSSP